MFYTFALSTLGAGALAGHALFGRKQPTLVEQLASSRTTLLDLEKNNQEIDDDEQRLSFLSRPLGSSHATRHFALSASLLGLTTIGTLGLPLLRLLSLPGLLYLDFYFLHMAYGRWQETKRVSIETNDAALATGLLVTHQLGAGALFATFFFTSRLLQEQTNTSLAQEDATIRRSGEAVMPSVTSLPVTSLSNPSAPDVAEPVNDAHWRSQIDQGALPLFALSAISAPFLGLHRSLSVLVANFGYDYRITAPLSTSSYMQTAKEQGIWLQSEQAFECLSKVELLVVDDNSYQETKAALGQNNVTSVLIVQSKLCDSETAAQIKYWQKEGHTVAYVNAGLGNNETVTQADVVIALSKYDDTVPHHGEFSSLTTASHANVVLNLDQPKLLQELFALAAARKSNQQQGFVLALLPSVVNLGGIFFLHFGPITALLVDYGGLSIGVLNALRPRLLTQSDLETSSSLSHVRPTFV